MLALLVLHVPIARSRARELRAALGAGGFGGHAGLLALVAQQVAEGREPASIAVMVPTLWPWA